MSGKVVFRTEWFAVEEVPGQPGWGGEGKPFYFITGADGVIVLPITADRRVVMVRQYRPARGRTTIELPAGAIDAGENPAEAALRELREEAGYGAREMLFLGKSGLGINRDRSNQFCFLALGAEKLPDLVPEAGIEVVLLAPDDIAEIARKGDFEQLGGLGVIALAQLLFADRIPRFC